MVLGHVAFHIFFGQILQEQTQIFLQFDYKIEPFSGHFVIKF